MNILIIPSWYTTPENPISGIFFKEQALALQSYFERFMPESKGYVLSLEAFSVFSIKTYLKRKSFCNKVEDGIPTIRSKLLMIPKLHEKNYYRAGKKLSRLVKKAQNVWNVHFDLVHIHSALEAGIWYNFSDLNIPYVLTEHMSSYSRGLITNLQKRYLPQVFSKASSLIAVGNGLVKSMREYTDRDIKVIFNIVTNKYAELLKTVENKKNEVFTLFSLGVNARKKGYDVLLSAFQKFMQSENNGKLIIAGLEEAEKEWLLSLNISPDVMAHVELLGRLPREQVFSYMNACDCFALVSRHETFGVVFAEAMYCGKPVIASITGGPDSFVNQDNGILVPTEDVEKTAGAMIAMKNTIASYSAEKIRAFAEENFSPDVICKQLCSVYDEVMKMNRGGTTV